MANRFFITFAGTAMAGLLLLASCNSQQSYSGGDVSLSSEIDSVSYALGYQNGTILRQQGMDDINLDLILAGMYAGLEQEEDTASEAPLSQQEMQMVVQRYQQQKQQQAQQEQQQQAVENEREAEEFLESNRSKDGVQETESGLQYEVIEEGDGASPSEGSTVRVHYEGTLLDGTVFDSSYERDDPVEFPLDQVIPGWTEGVQLMREGGKYRFWIPGDLGYGSNPNPNSPIGPNQLLVFEVELLEVVENGEGEE